MLKQEIILIGGGGHCKACIDVIEQTNLYQIMGVLDRPDLVGTNVLGYEITGTDSDIVKYRDKGYHFLITVGQIKSAEIRKRIYELLQQSEAVMATVISPLAYVSKHARIGKGTIVMHNVVVNADAIVGENCILNTGCAIEHETIIGNNTHISTFAIVNGGCIVGNEVFVGSNSTLSNQINLSNNVIIGSGSVVLKSINELGIFAGNPLKRIT